MSEKPKREYGGGDAGLVSHDVEPPERFAFRLRGVTADDLWDAELVEFITGRAPDVPDGLRELAESIRARDATLRLAVLEEAARVCQSEADARAIRELKRRSASVTP